MPCLSCHFLTVGIVRNRRDLPRRILRLIISAQYRTMFVIDLLPAQRLSVYKQFHHRRIGYHTDIHRLSRIEIPVREYVYKRFLRPRCLIDIVTVLREARGIDLSEIGIAGMVRRRLSDVIKARPQKLSHGKVMIPLLDHAVLRIGCAPAGGAVAQ